jgi:hypothetical protein
MTNSVGFPLRSGKAPQLEPRAKVRKSDRRRHCPVLTCPIDLTQRAGLAPDSTDKVSLAMARTADDGAGKSKDEPS